MVSWGYKTFLVFCCAQGFKSLMSKEILLFFEREKWNQNVQIQVSKAFDLNYSKYNTGSFWGKSLVYNEKNIESNQLNYSKCVVFHSF